MRDEFEEKRKLNLAQVRSRLLELPIGDYVLELGCGHGHFLTALAGLEKTAGNRYIGIDKKRDRLLKAKKKSDRAGSSNSLDKRQR